tara:strand:+ start:194 stop:1045 length:852 start_codon:yes stop_codon:yes gene_type:complete
MTATVGISFHTRHFHDIFETFPEISFFEIHSENYMTPGGLSRQMLREIRDKYSLSAHGVGLSLGSADGLDPEHLRALKDFHAEFLPFLVSEHLSWSQLKGTYLNDLLPIPYTIEALNVFEETINQAQDFLGRQILIENPSTYMTFKDNDFTESAFLNELCKQTGCGILLDVNNIFVSCFNASMDPVSYLSEIIPENVGQYHLAGHARHPTVYIDHHGATVSEEVWDLFEVALNQLGPHPTLIEWDTDVPELSVLVGEANRARSYIDRSILTWKEDDDGTKRSS